MVIDFCIHKQELERIKEALSHEQAKAFEAEREECLAIVSEVVKREIAPMHTLEMKMRDILQKVSNAGYLAGQGKLDEADKLKFEAYKEFHLAFDENHGSIELHKLITEESSAFVACIEQRTFPFMRSNERYWYEKLKHSLSLLVKSTTGSQAQ
ncbi:MAG: hypothetical protein EOP06_01115 [Proteobacteria bacterium]|nr:MAG: hypothetical protein EOP06_01115 [Pseudomonadota bacterium]